MYNSHPACGQSVGKDPQQAEVNADECAVNEVQPDLDTDQAAGDAHMDGEVVV